MKIQNAFYTITTYPNLLSIETFLAWDERTVQKHIDDVKSIVTQCYQNKCWALLSDRSSWQLSTPEAEELFTETALGALNDTLTHIAIVVGESEIKKWQIAKMINTFGKYETEFFKDTNEAESWLASFGYHMTSLDYEG